MASWRRHSAAVQFPVKPWRSASAASTARSKPILNPRIRCPDRRSRSRGRTSGRASAPATISSVNAVDSRACRGDRPRRDRPAPQRVLSRAPPPCPWRRSGQSGRFAREALLSRDRARRPAPGQAASKRYGGKLHGSSRESPRPFPRAGSRRSSGRYISRRREATCHARYRTVSPRQAVPSHRRRHSH